MAGLAGAGGFMSGSGQMIANTLAAGLAVNSEWFTPSADVTDNAGCQSESATADIQSGWPLASSLEGMTSICWRRRRLIFGGSWSSWRLISGNTIQGFIPNVPANTPAVRNTQEETEPEKLTS